MWHVTRDTWHVTRDTWQVWGGEHSLKISAPKLLLFVIYDIMNIWRKRLTESVNQLMCNEAVCRTAPATPGLLNKKGRTRWSLLPVTHGLQGVLRITHNTQGQSS